MTRSCLLLSQACLIANLGYLIAHSQHHLFLPVIMDLIAAAIIA